MNRKEVEDVLNEQLRASMCFKPLDEFYKEFQIWQEAVRNDVKDLLSGKKRNMMTVPTTPMASRRGRRRLSVITESPAGDTVKLNRKSRTKINSPTISENTDAKNQHSVKENPAKRTKLTFNVSEEETDDVLETVDSISQELVNTCTANMQALKSKSLLGDVDQISSREENNEMTSNSPQELIDFEKIPLSNSRVSQNVGETFKSQDQYPVDICPTGSHTSLSETGREIIDIVNVEKKRSTLRKRGKSKKISNVVHSKRFTGSKRITRSTAKASLDVSNATRESQEQHLVDVFPTVPYTVLSEAESTNTVSVEKTRSTLRRKGRPKSNSIVSSDKTCPTSKRNTQSNATASQNEIYQTLESLHQRSVGVSPTVSRTTLPKSVRESIDSASLESNKRTLEGKEKPMNHSNLAHEKIFSTSETNTRLIDEASQYLGCERPGSVLDVAPEMSHVSPSVNSNDSADLLCKNLLVRLTRIDKTGNLPEDVHQMCSENNISVTSKKRTGESSDDTRQRSLERNSVGEKRKRSPSYSHNQQPSKKSHLLGKDKENKDINFIGNVEEGKIRSSQRLSLLQNKSHSISASSERRSRLRHSLSEVISFSELVRPSERTSGNDIFENSIVITNSEEEEEEANDINNKADSGRGNSTDSEVEYSEYYSVGSKVDVDSARAGQEDVNACNVPVLASGSDQMQSQRKNTEKLATTPDIRGSRKGAHAALFSPYANEPVKNRVAAYEVLSSVAEEVEIPATTRRVTRTKTRAIAAAAAAAAAAASQAGVLEQKYQMNNSNTKPDPARKLATASAWRTKKKLTAASAQKNDASKENSFVSASKKTGKPFNFTPLSANKILADVNGFSSQLNSSRKTPMTGPKSFTVTSANQSSNSAYKPGIIHTNMTTFVKKNTKPVEDSEIRKKEEQKKREEKEREAQRRREEHLRKQAEEKKRKRDEIRLRVQEKREAQEKEKQESQLRVGKEKDEKWNIIQQEREAKQKGNVLKKKLETERKAAEAKRKLEEAEVARLAKLKMEELQRNKENEEAEKEKQRRVLEEKEAALLSVHREKMEQMMREAIVEANKKAESQKNTNISKLQAKEVKTLDTTFTKQLESTFTQPLDSTFTKPLDATFTKPLDSTFTKPLDSTFSKLQNSTLNHFSIELPKPSKKKKKNNAYNLEDLPSGDSDDELEEPPKKVARWALRSEVLLCSGREYPLIDTSAYYYCTPKTINIAAVFPNKKVLKRTSSAIWHTPPRYSCLPKY